MKGLCIENYKTLPRQIKDRNKESYVERVNIVKMSILPKEIPNQYSASFFKK